MLDFQQKRKIRGVMYSRVTLYVLLVVLLFVMHSTWGVYQKKRASDSAAKQSLQNVEDLRHRTQELESKINRLDTELGIEEEIRSKFSVTKENESMVVLVSEDEKDPENNTESQDFWTKVKNMFSW